MTTREQTKNEKTKEQTGNEAGPEMLGASPRVSTECIASGPKKRLWENKEYKKSETKMKKKKAKTVFRFFFSLSHFSWVSSSPQQTAVCPRASRGAHCLFFPLLLENCASFSLFWILSSFAFLPRRVKNVAREKRGDASASETKRPSQIRFAFLCCVFLPSFIFRFFRFLSFFVCPSHLAFFLNTAGLRVFFPLRLPFRLPSSRRPR